MHKPTITEVENAFQPAKEISDAARFAGRKQPVSEAFYALIAAGSHIAIVGNRGIGKTSLSRQIVNIATGDDDLLKALAETQAPDGEVWTTNAHVRARLVATVAQRT